MALGITKAEILKKLEEMPPPKIGVVEYKIDYFRVIRTRKGWSIQDFRDEAWYRYDTAIKTANKLFEMIEREDRISKMIREDVKSLHEQEKWEATHNTITGEELKKR